MNKNGKDTTGSRYETIGRKCYGTACEFDGCGWSAAPCDVHHINYQEHNRHEVAAREQMEKDGSSSNLAVLCPNHHRIVHHIDMGLALLQHILARVDTYRETVRELPV